MDLMLQIGKEHGFYTENYEYYVGSIGNKEKNWENLIGLWNHLDVVPVGDDWKYPPFGAVREGDLILGRGSQDNKGPAVAMLYVMECIRELKLDIGHELRLFVGYDRAACRLRIAHCEEYSPDRIVRGMFYFGVRLAACILLLHML